MWCLLYWQLEKQVAGFLYWIFPFSPTRLITSFCTAFMEGLSLLRPLNYLGENFLQVAQNEAHILWHTLHINGLLCWDTVLHVEVSMACRQLHWVKEIHCSITMSQNLILLHLISDQGLYDLWFSILTDFWLHGLPGNENTQLFQTCHNVWRWPSVVTAAAMTLWQPQLCDLWIVWWLICRLPHNLLILRLCATQIQ